MELILMLGEQKVEFYLVIIIINVISCLLLARKADKLQTVVPI